MVGLVKPGDVCSQGREFFEPQTQRKENLSAMVLKQMRQLEACLQFETTLGVSLLQVLDSFGQVPLPPYITNSQADRSQYQTVYAQRLGASRLNSWATFYATVTKPIAGTGHRFVFVTACWGGNFRSVCRWRTLRLTKCMESGRGFRRNGGAIHQTKAVRSDCGGHNGYELWKRQLNPAATTVCGKTNLFIYPGYQWRVV